MIRKFCLFFVTVTICIHLQSHQIDRSEKAKYFLSVCAIFKNEAKYLKEWIEYHRLVGVDHFYLYNNNSSDRPDKVLKSYIDKGIVTLINWPDRLGHQRDTFMWSLGVQIPAYENAIYWTALKKTEWLAVLDVDEFLIPIEGNALIDMLVKYKQYPGVILTRTYYNASVSDSMSNKNLVIKSVRRIKDPCQNYLPKSVEKMIFQPGLCEAFSWPSYRCIFKDDRQPIELTQLEGRVNQYSNRNTKEEEGEKNKQILQIDPRIFQEQQLDKLLDAGYKIEDPEKAIYRFVPEVCKRMGY